MTAILLLWTLMQALTVIGVANYLRHVPRERLTEGPPGAVVIAAVRGQWPGAAAFVAALLAQDGVTPRLLFALGGPDDPAWPELDALRRRHPDRIALVAAGVSTSEGQKIHKLRAAVATLRPDDRLVVFLDTDIVPPPRLVGRLLFPIVRGKADIATGYRLLLPVSRNPLPALVAAVDLQIATLPRPPRSTLPWGGAMAMTRATFDALGIEQAWRGRLSDDLTIARLARAAKINVRPVRDLLIASPFDGSSSAAIAFGVRQYRHLFWNMPSIWASATAIAALQAAGWAWALLYGGWPAIAIGYAAAWARTALRATVVRRVLPDVNHRAVLACDALLPFALYWAHLAFALAGRASRRIRWGAFDYDLAHGGVVTRVIPRPASSSAPPLRRTPA